MKINCFAGLFQPPYKFSNIFGKISENLFARAVLVKLKTILFFICYLVTPQPILGQCRRNSFTQTVPCDKAVPQGQVERPAVTDTFPIPIPSSSMPSSNYDNISNKASKYCQEN